MASRTFPSLCLPGHRPQAAACPLLPAVGASVRGHDKGCDSCVLWKFPGAQPRNRERGPKRLTAVFDVEQAPTGSAVTVQTSGEYLAQRENATGPARPRPAFRTASTIVLLRDTCPRPRPRKRQHEAVASSTSSQPMRPLAAGSGASAGKQLRPPSRVTTQQARHSTLASCCTRPEQISAYSSAPAPTHAAWPRSGTTPPLACHKATPQLAAYSSPCPLRPGPGPGPAAAAALCAGAAGAAEGGAATGEVTTATTMAAAGAAAGS